MADIDVSALYYPHTAIRSVKLLKAALLLWDSIECIVPRRAVPPPDRSRDIAEATDLVVRPHRPSPEAQARVHQRLTKFLKGGPPAWLRASAGPQVGDSHYLMYPDKLADETWRMLEHHDLAELGRHDFDYAVPPALGLLLLAMLADECAGTTKTKVTDREQAYSWLFGVMTTELGGEYLPSMDASHLADSYDRLLTATVRIINTDPIPLKRLIKMRLREASGKTDLRQLRKNYLERISAQVRAMVAPRVTVEDKVEIVRRFEKDMRDDLRILKEELGSAAKEVLFSKEIGVCALAVAGAAFVPASIPVAATVLKSVGVGALLTTHLKYKKARKKALRDHSMSWLYTVV